jgi:DNA-binding Lrp family transcriptional regulator
MSNDKKIIRDLTVSRSSTGALADCLNLPAEAVLIILNRLESEGIVESFPFESCASITIWRLTLKGKSTVIPTP